MMQDHVPQARIYKVWNIPGYKHARLHAARHDLRTCSAAARTAGSTSAWSTRTAPPPRSRRRRPVRDRLAVPDHRHREAGRRSGRGREGARRRTGEVPRAPGPTAAELERVRTRELRELRARHRAHRRLRRQVVRSSPRARCTAARRISTRRGSSWVAQCDAGRRAGRGEALAVRWRVRAQRAADAGIQDRGVARCDRSKRADDRHAAVAEAAAARARQAVQWPEGRRGRAAQRAGRRLHADRRRGFRGGQSRPSPAPRGSPCSCSRKARRRAIRSQIAERAESLGAPLGVGLVARSLVPQHECAQRASCGESLDLYTDVLLNPTFPDKELERLRGADARRHPAGEGAAAAASSIACCRSSVRRGPCVLEPVLGHRHGGGGQEPHAARSSRRSTSAGSGRTMRCC